MSAERREAGVRDLLQPPHSYEDPLGAPKGIMWATPLAVAMWVTVGVVAVLVAK